MANMENTLGKSAQTNSAAKTETLQPAKTVFSGGICAIIKEITRQAGGKITPAEIADKLKKAGLPITMGTIARQSQEVKKELGVSSTGSRKNFTIEL